MGEKGRKGRPARGLTNAAIEAGLVEKILKIVFRRFEHWKLLLGGDGTCRGIYRARMRGV